MNRYVLNVSVDGRHYCRVQIPEILPKEAHDKAREIKWIFMGALKGDLRITLCCWKDVGQDVEIV